MGLGESVCVESPMKLVGTWDLLLIQCTHNQPRDPPAAQTEALSPLASSTQSSREDVSRLGFKSPGLTLRLLRVSKGPLRFKLGTLPMFHPYRHPETLPLLPLFCRHGS